MKLLLVFGLLLGITVTSALSLRPDEETPEQLIRQRLITQADNFGTSIQLIQKAVERNASPQQIQRAFFAGRLAYKKLEWATEYFTPDITRQVNGPPVPEAELTGPIIEPDGLQVIEGLLFPKYQTSKKRELITRLRHLKTLADVYRDYFHRAELFSWQIFDASKLEIFRIETLGITGFDNPLSKNSMQESATSLASLQQVMAYYTRSGDDYGLHDRLSAAIHYLQQHTNFNTFDRAVFLTEYANPLTISLTRLHQHTKIAVVKYNRLLSQDAETLFDVTAINSNAYTAGPEDFMTAQKIALGKKLFFDPILSGTQTRSCSSCHQSQRSFTDGMVKNTDITGKGLISRNTPTLINAALQPAQFYDLRALSLESQVIDVLQNRNEMHGDMQLSIRKLWRDPVYHKLFSNAFPVRNRSGIDTLEVMNSLASYIRSLTALNSRFDDYMRGKKAALNSAEINGFNLFMGKARCATCHYMPLFNGTVPPRYMRIDAEVIGVPQTKSGKKLDPDPGRYAIIPLEFNRHAFKTPTLRNAARTAPYMHNGVYSSLTEVMDFYNKGGGTGLGLKIDNQTLPFDNLNLTNKESNEIIAFIKSLDSK